MGERTSHPPGTFSWAELATSDADAAKGFYTELFGWEYDDNPAGDDQVYSMAKRDGQYVAALFSADQPPHWNCYVTVASADDAAAAAKDAGGAVAAEPFDVMDVGRMNTPGSLTWNDLVTPDPEGAEQFYGTLFGWTFEEIPGAGGYRTIRNGDRMNGGIMPSQDGPPSWLPYFGHDDVDRLTGEIEGLGGRLYNGPVRMPQGSIAVLGDPQGAVFAVWTGRYED